MKRSADCTDCAEEVKRVLEPFAAYGEAHRHCTGDYVITGAPDGTLIELRHFRAAAELARKMVAEESGELATDERG